MLHSYVHGGDCVAIQYNDQTLVINQTTDNIQQIARITQHPWVVSVSYDSVISGMYWNFSVKKLNWGIIIVVADVCIVYHYRDPDFSLDRVPDLLLVDMSMGLNVACAVAARVKWKTIVPIALTSTDDPIGFCREVLLYNWWVPKYLKPGQYVVH
jgi:hypothetical protein